MSDKVNPLTVPTTNDLVDSAREYAQQKSRAISPEAQAVIDATCAMVDADRAQWKASYAAVNLSTDDIKESLFHKHVALVLQAGGISATLSTFAAVDAYRDSLKVAAATASRQPSIAHDLQPAQRKDGP